MSRTRAKLCFLTVVVMGLLLGRSPLTAQESGIMSRDPRWRVSEPLIEADPARLPPSDEHPWVAIKDPSVVRVGERWHLFCTIRRRKEGEGRIRIGYTSFEDWESASEANWSLLELTPDYHGAPQVFFFEPERRWYLIYQAADPARGLAYGPCYSTNERIDDPNGWTLPRPLYVVPEGQKAGLDFWLICDETHAHLFFTTNNGQMWRAETTLEDFPDQGWSVPEVALRADIFEANHTYKLLGQDEYFMFIEAQGRGRRYFKSYRAESLRGPWEPIADSIEHPFVGVENVINQNESWTTNYSHGEAIRAGYNQRMELDPQAMRLVFQGANDEEYKNSYGLIPWRLGILERVPASRD